jgi:hypothetical protein
MKTMNWQDEAQEYLRRYIRETMPESLIAPAFRRWAMNKGISFPPSVYSWGRVLRDAAARGVIVEDGFTMYSGDLTQHAQSVRRWRPVYSSHSKRAEGAFA